MELRDSCEQVDRQNRYMDVNRWTDRTDRLMKEMDRWHRWTDRTGGQMETGGWMGTDGQM